MNEAFEQASPRNDSSLVVIGAAGLLVLLLAAIGLWLVFGDEVIRDMASRAWALCF